MPKIKYLKARQILDSRGSPTVEVDMSIDDGEIFRASVPSGASTGKYEAVELRDNNDNYNGKSVHNAVSNVNDLIKNKIINKNFNSIYEFDNEILNLDNTANKSNLGANAILACSLSFIKCLANNCNKSLYEFLLTDQEYILPCPLMNIINGGAHANNGLDIQEFMIIPAGFKSFSDSLQAGVETFLKLKELLNKKSYSTAVGDEGGFAPDLKTNEEALNLILDSITLAGYEPGKNIFLALDVASSELYNQGKYSYDNELLSSSELIGVYKDLTSKFPIISIEDPLDEDDWESWKSITKSLGNSIQLVGDDLFVTNKSKLQMGIDTNAANSILVKINQIGSISETLDTINMAKNNNYSYIISHRSGETEDSSIADIAVGTKSGQIKTGSCSRSDRTAKYNQLLRIEDQLKGKCDFAGLSTFKISS
ncbi:MAG: phosphopyruvate hydratase [Thermodesulfobacteriota bacterium]|nr:phosphopyruvate hydratase [Thermodesulfobacteriota bacterium]|tara:strand:+ start:16882 stop:18156 length:1275 start_codon:yes stop_codon:yes gene_type:complete